MKRTARYPVRDAVPYAIDLASRKLRQAIDTMMARFSTLWWGIEMDESVIFRGRPIFRRHPTAEIRIGKGCIFNSAEWSNTIGLNRRCFISATRHAKICVGENNGFSGTVIAASKSINIGNRVLCGGNCTIVDTDRHPLEMGGRLQKEEPQSGPIYIEDDVFLGMNVLVLKGSRIGRGAVIAANSVVTGEIPEGVIAAGSPARVIRSLE